MALHEGDIITKFVFYR